MKMASSANPTARRLWLAVATGFLLLATAWTALLIAARHADTRTVPLAAQPGKS